MTVIGKSFLFGIAFGAAVLLGSACRWPTQAPWLGQWSRVDNRRALGSSEGLTSNQA